MRVKIRLAERIVDYSFKSSDVIRSVESLRIEGETFRLVKRRQYEPVSVYKGKGTFLRIGPKETIQKQLDMHKKLLKFKFPVARIIKEGEFEGKCFYAEQSLGNSPLAISFSEDWKEKGTISPKNFSLFLSLTKKFAEAQLSSITSKKYPTSFYEGIHMGDMCKELPAFKLKLMEAFEKAMKSLSEFPTVIIHPDLNPYNFLPDGIIDLENTFYGSAGYDITGNVYAIFLFPKNGDYEAVRGYEFTKTQINTYLKTIDQIYAKRGLPKPSEHKDDFMFAKSIWSAVKMQRAPKLQKWRYDLLRTITTDYLDGKPIVDTIKNFKS